jgi:hypothetical protein
VPETGSPKHKFHVSIGVDLPAEAVARISQAIQKSVLAELYDEDLNGGAVVP